MDNNFESFYTGLDLDDKHIFHVLALCPNPICMSDLIKVVNIRHTITNKHLRETLFSAMRYYVREIYRDFFLLDANVLVWIFPLITGYQAEKDSFETYSKRKNLYYYQQASANKYILAYLDALVYRPQNLKNSEAALFGANKTDCLASIFNQPLYESVFDRLSVRIVDLIFPQKFRKVVDNLDPLNRLRQIESKLEENNSDNLNIQRAILSYKDGHWLKTQELTDTIDCPVSYFAKASLCTVNGLHDEALDFFEKGMKKQRRDQKQSYIPVIPEAALFYIISLISGEQEKFLPVLGRISDPKTKSYCSTDGIFLNVCRYLTSNMYDVYSQRFKSIDDYDVLEVRLWKVIALGITGEKPDTPKEYISAGLELTKRALMNGYLTAAYEAAFALMKMGSEEAADIYRQLAEKMNYKPVLSMVKHIEEWEKQINAYLSLDAVKTIIRQESEVGKSRVAYRFFPKGGASPILQTRQAGGGWTAGRNISMANFIGGNIDGMTEQDKRIASFASHYSYYLDRKCLVEMTGHPYVFLELSDIPVELVAARPVLSVVESARGGYKLESDVTNLMNDVYIEKETGTRYKVYHIDKYQREIIESVKKGKKIPVAGKDMLIKVLEHFSAYLTVHTDLIIDGAGIQTRQVDADSHIHIQLLPLGEGLKAEMFVKPFGEHPPYCKPGKGGKTLLVNQNGERLQVTRDLQTEIQNADRLLADIQTIEGFDVNDGIMAFDNPLDALELLDILKNHVETTIVEWPEGERLKVKYSANFNNLCLRMKSGVDWFEIDGELKLDEQTVITIGKLIELVNKGHGRFVELAEGEFIALSEQLKRRLSELGAFSTASKNKIAINRFASASIADSFDDFGNMKVDRAWLDFRKRLRAAQDTAATVPATLHAELRPYQEEGYRWMIRLSTWGAGACLADDMGLGKTVQAIAVMLHRASLGPALVVSPVSVQPNWSSEVRRFAPSLTVKTLNAGSRAEILDSLGAGDLLVTSYGLLQSEEKALTAVEWATVTLDEAHAIKNYNTKTSKAAMLLKAGFRMVLTGTPIQNHLGEMWNIFQFINPGLLGTLQHFNERFIKPVDKDTRKCLKKLITPFILRRTKTAVLDELPPKTEIIRKIALSTEEMSFYEVLRRRAVESIRNDDSPQGARHLKALAEITRLRQACCNMKMVDPKINIESTKLGTFLEIADELKENGHRALVFSQFVTHLSIVRKALDKQGFSYQYLDGATPTAKREMAVKKFQAGESDLFLISLKAGGLGLNLTAADFVIHLDPWWNPAVEDQASDRAHRIGQNRPVTVYRLVTEHTIEEKIIQLHNTKRDLADSLLEGSDRSAKLSMDELLALIREENF